MFLENHNEVMKTAWLKSNISISPIDWMSSVQHWESGCQADILLCSEENVNEFSLQLPNTVIMMLIAPTKMPHLVIITSSSLSSQY